MKRSSLILSIIFLITVGSLQRIEAQGKTKEDKEKELRMQEAIEQQKKVMHDQQKKALVELKKAQSDIEKNLQEEQIEIERNIKENNPDRGDREIKVMTERVNRILPDEPFIYSEPDFDFYNHSFDNSERTSWEFSKSVRETSFSRDYTFDVEPTVNTVALAVNGDCKSGEIRIKILMPNGKIYSDIVLDEFGNLNWRKSFNISDTENKDKAGPWKFEINSAKASGYFKISLQTY
ncbi:MAG: hypothetical protein QG576_204 [Bacteroidota bacterium]|nr:hypothetical protein [Bacteroidota bacterium]